MASEVQIINLALIRLGVKPITTRTDDTRNAILANAIYEQTRDTLLAHGYWSRAIRRAKLTAVASTDSRLVYGYDYGYTLPSDFVFLSKFTNLRYPHRIEGDLLFTDASTDVYITYISNSLDYYKKDPTFCDCLSWKLAMELAKPLNADTDSYKMAAEGYENALMEAKYRSMMNSGSGDSFHYNRINHGGFDSQLSNITNGAEGDRSGA